MDRKLGLARDACLTRLHEQHLLATQTKPHIMFLLSIFAPSLPQPLAAIVADFVATPVHTFVAVEDVDEDACINSARGTRILLHFLQYDEYDGNEAAISRIRSAFDVEQNRVLSEQEVHWFCEHHTPLCTALAYNEQCSFHVFVHYGRMSAEEGKVEKAWFVEDMFDKDGYRVEEYPYEHRCWL